MTTVNAFQAAFDQLRTINTRERRSVMGEERDTAETRKAALSLEIANQRADITAMEHLLGELQRAMETKRTLLSETLATYASVVRSAADLDIQSKQLDV